VQAAHETAAMLTAAAYGLDTLCFVAPCDAGLGLFARSSLRRGQAIVEYFGPRLPLSQLKRIEYALEVPDDSGTFIDGNHENGGRGGGARSLAIYANHSRTPNCSLQHWPAAKSGGKGLDSLWIVAKEPIDAGCELRFDYEEGGSNYWNGCPPRETDKWRTHRVPAPQPSGVEPCVDYLPLLLAGEPREWPEGEPGEGELGV